MSATIPQHVRLDDHGIAWIDDTNVKVIEIVLDKIAHGWSPEEIAYQHYDSLSLAQIYAALSYYYDHQSTMDAAIDGQLGASEQARSRTMDSPGRRRLKAQGKIA